jgi:hypothetical protein
MTIFKTSLCTETTSFEKSIDVDGSLKWKIRIHNKELRVITPYYFFIIFVIEDTDNLA